jgi:hypothetical protein
MENLQELWRFPVGLSFNNSWTVWNPAGRSKADVEMDQNRKAQLTS